MLKRLFFPLIALSIFICGGCHFNKQKKQQKSQAFKPALKVDIIGEWKLAGEYPGIDTFNIAKFQDINLESNLSFYDSGRFKKGNNYTSDYKVNGDTLLLYDPVIKHWYKLHPTIITRDSVLIDSYKGYDHLDTYYKFKRVGGLSN